MLFYFYIDRFKWQLVCKFGIVDGNFFFFFLLNSFMFPYILSVFKSFLDNSSFNTLRPRQNGHHFADDTFKRIFLDENVRVSIIISLKFVLKGPIDNIPALVQVMAWHRSGAKPLSEPMMVNSLTHICVIRPQWVNAQALWTAIVQTCSLE